MTRPPPSLRNTLSEAILWTPIFEPKFAGSKMGEGWGGWVKVWLRQQTQPARSLQRGWKP